jgi:hypothetical protein
MGDSDERGDAGGRLRIEILTLEHQTLRAEILQRSAGRLQLVSIATAGSAILATAATADDGPNTAGMALAAGLLLSGLIAFARVWLGRDGARQGPWTSVALGRRTTAAAG